ncbi:MAG TPA: DUF6782 family putative metallopeptidase [Azospirillum sp.]|nr:DUF6782 family putative metallopeptidase [Azospirillum sp.]
MRLRRRLMIGAVFVLLLPSSRLAAHPDGGPPCEAEKVATQAVARKVDAEASPRTDWFLRQTMTLARRVDVTRSLLDEATRAGVRIVAVSGLRSFGVIGSWYPEGKLIFLDVDRPETRVTVLAHELLHATRALHGRGFGVAFAAMTRFDRETWAVGSTVEEGDAHAFEIEVADTLDRMGIDQPLLELRKDPRTADIEAAWRLAHAASNGDLSAARAAVRDAFAALPTYESYLRMYKVQYDNLMTACNGP